MKVAKIGKTNIIFALLIVAVLSFGIYSLTSTLFAPKLALEEEGKGPASISVTTEVEQKPIHLGDTFFYRIKVWYQPEWVKEIDKTSLDKTVILDPFQIRSLREEDSKVDSETRVYLREYEIQLLDGKTDQLYTFPTITARYKHKSSTGSAWINVTAVPQPISVGTRIPSDNTGLSLKSLEGKVKNINYDLVPWALWSFAFLFIALGINRITREVLKQNRERKDWRRKLEGWEDLFGIFEEIKKKAPTEDPKAILHRIYQLLRVFLNRKEKIEGMDDSALNKLPQDLKALVLDLKKICQDAYGSEPASKEEAKEAVDKLAEIINFYLEGNQKGEVK